MGQNEATFCFRPASWDWAQGPHFTAVREQIRESGTGGFLFSVLQKAQMFQLVLGEEQNNGLTLYSKSVVCVCVWGGSHCFLFFSPEGMQIEILSSTQ